MLSSYVKACHRYPLIVVSFLEASRGFIHSCHFVIQVTSVIEVIFLMLVTYTENGVRLSCSEFNVILFLRGWDDSIRKAIGVLMEKHRRVS